MPIVVALALICVSRVTAARPRRRRFLFRGNAWGIARGNDGNAVLALFAARSNDGNALLALFAHAATRAMRCLRYLLRRPAARRMVSFETSGRLSSVSFSLTRAHKVL